MMEETISGCDKRECCRKRMGREGSQRNLDSRMRAEGTSQSEADVNRKSELRLKEQVGRRSSRSQVKRGAEGEPQAGGSKV